MTNPEAHPTEQWCSSASTALLPPLDAERSPVTQVLTPRDVPLGGPRAMTVRRTLPQRERSLIGAWCFADHYGPDDVSRTRGMDVPPHPHTGLQTVSWLFAGEIEHRDSLGVHALVRPGELNLMTAGHGIAHSEVSTPGTALLHGVQLWIALPDHARDVPRDFAHHVPEPVDLGPDRGGSAVARVFLGSLFGMTAPVPTFSPLVGAEVVLPARAELTLDVDPAFEHGVLVDQGSVRVGSARLSANGLGYVPAGVRRLALAAGSEPCRLLLLGGEPLGEELVMWWNFVGRNHEEIVEFRRAWQEGSARFGDVIGYGGEVQRLPAPVLPNVRIKPRRRP